MAVSRNKNDDWIEQFIQIAEIIDTEKIPRIEI